MAFQRAILPAVLSWADKLVMIGKYWNTYLIACQCYIYYIAYTGAPSELMCSHFFDGIDLIVPVPLHQRKKRLRGYNQSECLARGVSVVTGIPMDTKVVIRSRYTDTQTHKGQYARWENVRNLFACIFPDSLEGKHLLLVDDVLTTGATVVSCADAFRGIPGLRISVLTLALAGES